MDKPDGRLLNPTTQNYLRQQAIRLREKGKRIGEIASYLGVHRTTVSGWWSQYQQEGEAALNQHALRSKVWRSPHLESDRRSDSATVAA